MRQSERGPGRQSKALEKKENRGKRPRLKREKKSSRSALNLYIVVSYVLILWLYCIVIEGLYSLHCILSIKLVGRRFVTVTMNWH